MLVFNLVGGGGFMGEGTADFHQEMTVKILDGPCKDKVGYRKAKGKVKIEAGGGGTPFGGVIELRLGGDLPVEEHGGVGEEFHCKEVNKSYTAFYGAICRFQNVDMVHGGTFSTFDSSDAHGTCAMEISRK
jgi:hypothetical protein